LKLHGTFYSFLNSGFNAAIKWMIVRHDFWQIRNIATAVKDNRSGIWTGSGNSRTPSQVKIVIILPNSKHSMFWVTKLSQAL
jgi:hypothetical protein